MKPRFSVARCCCGVSPSRCETTDFTDDFTSLDAKWLNDIGNPVDWEAAGTLTLAADLNSGQSIVKHCVFIGDNNKFTLDCELSVVPFATFAVFMGISATPMNIGSNFFGIGYVVRPVGRDQYHTVTPAAGTETLSGPGPSSSHAIRIIAETTGTTNEYDFKFYVDTGGGFSLKRTRTETVDFGTEMQTAFIATAATSSTIAFDNLSFAMEEI